MKKMTKILSLVLALAMVLGMTAFAGTPSKLILKDDYSDLDVTTAAGVVKLQNATSVTAQLASGNYSTTIAVSRQAAIDAGTPLTGILNNRFYKSHNAGKFAVEEVNGTKYLTANTSTGWTSAHLAYAFDEPWTYLDKEGNPKNVALVAQIGWTGVAAKADEDIKNAQTTYGYFKTNDTYSYKSRLGFNAVRNAETGLHDNIAIYNYGGAVFYNAEYGKRYTVEMIYRPYKSMWYEDDLNVDTKLSSLMSFDRIATYKGGHFNEAINADEVQAIVYANPNNFTIKYDNFRAYEISLDRADFYMNTAAMKTTDLEPTDKLTVEFSQPISITMNPNSDANLIGNIMLAEKLVVAKGEEVLVYGEDYTVTFNEEKYNEIGGPVTGSLTVDVIDGLDYDSTYTVTLPAAIKNIARVTMATDNEHVATFTTQKAPTFALTLNAYEGLSTAGAAVTADAMAGKTVYFEANATNETGRALNGAIAIGIYNAQGALVKYAALNNSFADAATKAFGASFKMEEGYTAKAFVKGTASEIAFQ